MPSWGIGFDILNWPITLNDIAKVLGAASHLDKVSKHYRLDKPVSLVCGSAFANLLHEFVPKCRAEVSAELLVNAVEYTNHRQTNRTLSTKVKLIKDFAANVKTEDAWRAVWTPLLNMVSSLLKSTCLEL